MTNFVPSGSDATPAFTAPVGVMSVSEIATQASGVVTNVMRVEPMLAGIAGMFIPGLSLVQPWIVMLAPYLERSLDDISKNNNGDVLSALVEMIQHITAGAPNSATLSPTTSNTMAAPQTSNQGSG
jgi:hypothetical protein